MFTKLPNECVSVVLHYCFNKYIYVGLQKYLNRKKTVKIRSVKISICAFIRYKKDETQKIRTKFPVSSSRTNIVLVQRNYKFES